MAEQKKSIVEIVKEDLGKWQKDLATYALRDYDAGNFAKSALIAISENDDLKACFQTTEGKTSIYHALRRASSTGLSLNPQEGKACLIAYKGKASYQIMKNGMVDLALKDGSIKSIIVETLRENDEFKLDKKPGQDSYSFSPARKQRGGIDGFFCVITLTAGDTLVKYMAVDEVEEHGKKYSFGYDKEFSSWKKSFEGMGKKTVIKMAIKDLNVSPDLTGLFEADTHIEQDEKDITPPKTQGQTIIDGMKKPDAVQEPNEGKSTKM